MGIELFLFLIENDFPNAFSYSEEMVCQNHILGFVPGLHYKVRSVWKGNTEVLESLTKKCELQYFRKWKWTEV